MKSFKIFAMFAMLFVLASCAKKEKPQASVVEAPVEVYQPKHQTTDVNLAAIQKYEYRNAPSAEAAIAVEVKYSKVAYAEPITVKYSYKNGDTYTYVIPKNFTIWPNENGRLRVVKDADCTVWIQGQTKSGKFHEFVFYGDPKHNGGKIKPNSYRNLPEGEIKYRK